MADNIKVGVNVDDGGSTKKLITSAEALKRSYDSAAMAAAALTTKSAKATLAPKTAAALQGATRSPEEGIAYGVARSAVGTGAASRDFAKQAQGLGGLVHVYATFAANLFAVGAAFNALKNAADTTNMVKGLDQLGAQGGRNLGALSKRVAELSDGAVSLREAMTATAQATSAGMSSKNLERLTVVAKNASQALGLSMPDALSRLSRGVTKIEPELLDELGLFVKVDDAVTNYARSIGKTTTSLTDFERRHAFALATIEQGEKKFSSIQMDANPYSKLLASVSNLGQTVLETVNKGLTPLVTILSQSPAALGVTLAGIASILLKQAIPALGMYRQNARMMADEAHQRVLKSVKDQQEAASIMDTIAAKKAETQFQMEKATMDKVDKLRASQFNKKILGSDIRELVKKSPFDITAEETKALKDRSEALLSSDDATYRKQGEKLQKHLAKMDGLKAESTKRGDEAAAASEMRDAKWYSHQQQMQVNLDRLNKAAAKRQLLAGVADTAAIIGPTAAFKQLKDELNKLDASKVSKGFTALQGAISIASSAAMTAINAFGIWVTIFTAIGTAISMLLGYLSNTQKESVATAEAFDSVSSSVDNVTRTLEAMGKKSALEQISIEAIKARATAFNELAVNIETANEKAVKEMSKMGGSDKFVDWVKKLWGGDVQSKLDKTVSEGFASAVSAMEKGPASEKMRESIKKSLKIDIIDAKSIEKALAELPEQVRQAKIDSLTKDLKAAGLAAEVTAAKGVELKDSYAQATKQLQDLRNSFIPTDAVSKLGTTIIDSASKLNIALQDPVQTLNAMSEAVKDANSLSLFPPETAQALINQKSKVDALKNSYADASKSIDTTQEQIDKLLLKRKETEKWEFGQKMVQDLATIDTELSKLEKDRKAKVEILAEVKTKVDTLKSDFDAAIKEQFAYGAQLVGNRLSAEWAKAGATIGNTIAGMLGDTEAGIKMRAKYESAALEGQKQQILTQIELIKSNERLTIALEQASIDEQMKNADATDRKLIAPKQAALDRRKATVEGPITKGMTSQIVKDIKEGKEGAKESLGYIMAAEGAFASLANISAQMKAVAIKAAVDSVKLTMKDEQAALDIQAERLRLTQDGLSTLETIAGADSAILLTQKQSLQQDLLKYDNDKKLFDLKVQLATFELLQKSATNKEDKASIANDILKIKTKTEEAKITGKIAETNLKNKGVLEKINQQYAIESKEQDRLFKQLQESLQLDQDNLTNKEALLDMYKQLGGITNIEYLTSKNVLDNTKAQLDTQIKIDNVRKTSNDAIAAAELKIEQANAAKKTAPVEQQLALNQLIDEQTLLINRTTASADKQVSSLITQLGVRTQINAAILEQAVAMERVSTITENLTVVFGELGTKIGAALGEVVKFAGSSKTMEARHKEGLKGLEKGSDAYVAKEKDNAEERTAFELQSYTKIAGSAKNMFKEKTFAYKAFGALEKTLAMATIAINAQKLISDSLATGGMLANAGIRISAAIAEAEVNGVAGVVKAVAGWPFPFNLIAGAATAAVMMSLLNAVGGKGPGFSGGAVNTGTGTTFGDKTAVSESVSKSTETLSKSDPILMKNSMGMLRHLRNIDNNIAQLGVALIKSLPGGGDIATEKFGVQTGMKDSGIGSLLSKVPLVGGIVSGLLKGLGFGTKTSVAGQGIMAGPQTVGSIAQQGFQGSYYADVTSQKKAFGITYSTKNSTQTSALDTELQRTLGLIFTNAGAAMVDASKTLGRDTQSVVDKVNSFVIDLGKINLSGLSAADQQKRFEGVVGQQLDLLVQSVYPEIVAFIKVGEGAAATLSRVQYGIESTTVALEALGIQTISYTDILNKQGDVGAELARQSIAAVETQALIKDVIANADGAGQDIIDLYTQLDNLRDTIVNIGITQGLMSREAMIAAGGTEKFTDSISKLYDNFVTETQKAAINTQTVVDVFTSLNLQIPTSRQGVIDLVNSLAEVDPQAAGKIVGATDALNTFFSNMESLTGKLKSMQERILELTGTEAEITAAKRAAELQATDPALRATQSYIYALEDVKIAQTNLTNARKAEGDSLKSTINSLKGYADSLRKFRDSLLLGAQSTLSPQQKYIESKNQLDALLETANSAASTPAEIAAKNAAIDQIQSASTAFLEASRTYNASSAQYTDDFTFVQRALSSLSDTIDTQAIAAQKQLDALDLINESTLSVVDAVNALTLAVNTANSLKPASDTGIAAINTGTQIAVDYGRQASTTGKAIINNGIVYGAQGQSTTLSQGLSAITEWVNSAATSSNPAQMVSDLYTVLVDQWKLNSGQVAQIVGRSKAEVLDYFGVYGLPAFAKGTNYVPTDMLAQIHAGERIIPAADNARLMQSLGDRNETNRVLVEEIRNLRQEVKDLRDQQAKETGNIIIANLDAQQRNAEHIGEVINTTAQQSDWSAKVKEAVKLR